MIGSLVMLVLLALIAYAWGAYPLWLASAARRADKGARRTGGPAASPAAARVAIVLSAYNEEEHIGARIKNLLRCAERLGEAGRTGTRVTVFVGTDGCTDRTADVARESAAGRTDVHVAVFDDRRGKIAVLKDLVRRASPQTPGAGADILVFTDANSVFRDDALQRLVRHFDDAAVGGVCGRLVFVAGRDREEGLYWRWESRLKEKESVLDSCLGANGAIYAVRGGLFWESIPDNTIVDDFVVGMKVREQGYRMVYEPAAVAEEESPETVDEWRRRVRIGAGNFQALGLCRRCLLPAYGRFAWMFWSHKVLRWFTPHMLLGLAAGAACLACGRLDGPPSSASWLRAGTFTVAAGMLVLLLLGAVAGRLGRRAESAPFRFFRQCDHFLTMQGALFVGFLRFCRGNLAGQWARTPRRTGDS